MLITNTGQPRDTNTIFLATFLITVCLLPTAQAAEPATERLIGHYPKKKLLTFTAEYSSGNTNNPVNPHESMFKPSDTPQKKRILA